MQEDYLVETINYKGYDIKIYQDDYPENPRDWDYLLENAKEVIDYNIKVSRKARQNKVKTLIKKKVPLEKRTVILGV